MSIVSFDKISTPYLWNIDKTFRRTPLSHAQMSIFTKDNGEWLHPDSITRWLNNFSRDNGLPHIHPHAFRHTYASRCVERGVYVKSLSEMLGHADVGTTLQFYVHSSMEHKMRVIQSICFLESALKEDFSPSPPPSDGAESEKFRELLSKLPQMG